MEIRPAKICIEQFENVLGSVNSDCVHLFDAIQKLVLIRFSPLPEQSQCIACTFSVHAVELLVGNVVHIESLFVIVHIIRTINLPMRQKEESKNKTDH